MSRRRLLTALLIGATVAAVLLIGVEAFARVGGGQSYGGGGSGGGGGGDGIPIDLIIWLIIRHPKVGIPVAIIVAVVYVVRHHNKGKPGFGEGGGSVVFSPDVARQARGHSAGRLRDQDPGFSRFVFSEFAHLLYVRYQEARGRGAQGILRAWLAPELREGVEAEQVERVERVVVGSLDLRSIQASSGRDRIVVDVESNVDETAAGRTQRLFLQQRLHFDRKSGVRSPEPGKLEALRCPSCGSASELDIQGHCSHCHEVVDDGSFAWRLVAVETLRRQAQRPIDVKPGLGGDEPGVGLPSRLQAGLGAAMRAMSVRNPSFDWNRFRARVRHVFTELQEAWSSLKWEKARPYETDRLFQSHRFWIERYQAQGLRNALDQVTIHDVVPCKVERDPWYEIITVRIFASMLDYVVDQRGKVVGGNNKKPRRFSEYWTFIKRSGVTEKAASPGSCPSCGAPLDKVTQAGVCEYCGSKIVTGDFDWVLALIEQDEAYKG